MATLDLEYSYYLLLRFNASVDATRELSDDEIRDDIIPFFQTCYLNIKINYNGYDKDVNEVILTCEKENVKKMPNSIVINSKYVLNRRKVKDKYTRLAGRHTGSRNTSPELRVDDNYAEFYQSSSLSVGYKMRPIDAAKDFEQPTETKVHNDIYPSLQKLLPNCKQLSLKYNSPRQVVTIGVAEINDKQKLPDVFITPTYYLDILAPSKQHRYVYHTIPNSNTELISNGNGSLPCSPKVTREPFTSQKTGSVKSMADKIDAQTFSSSPSSPEILKEKRTFFFRNRTLDEEEIRMSRTSYFKSEDFTQSDENCSTLFDDLKIESNENSKLNLLHTNAITQLVIREGMLNESNCKIIVHPTDRNLTINSLSASFGFLILKLFFLILSRKRW